MGSFYRIALTAIVSIGYASLLQSEESAQRLIPEDLYRLEGPQQLVAAPHTAAAAVIYQRIDPNSKQDVWSLKWADSQGVRPLEPKELDARAVSFSPDGEWLAVCSTRPRPKGWKQIPPTPPQSDAATDIWLISADGKRAIPLAGPDKPYGRVFHDPFYGRVAFSPDGKSLVFIADDGTDPRTQEEMEADVIVVRSDQGEGYTGYGNAQVWVAELKEKPGDFAAENIRRVTSDGIWYGDPQWTPDGKSLIVHANKSQDTEAVRYSINKNYDLWSIDTANGKQRQLTFGPGPEVSPRVAPAGNQLVCLSSPRKGPHADIFNLMLVSLSGGKPASKVLYDHHAESSSEPPHPVPAFPLPDPCWDHEAAILYNTLAGLESTAVRVDITTGNGSEIQVDAEDDVDDLSPPVRQVTLQRRLMPPGNQFLKEKLVAETRVITWQNEGFELEGTVTLPPESIGKAPYPLVLFPHGGPHSRSSNSFNITVHVFAHAGYAVFQPNFRGSAGYGKRFLDADRNDLGGGDMRDILTGIEKLVEDKIVDPDRQFVYGVSYGGFMTTWLVGHTTQFRAAVAQNAVTDMNVMWGLSDIQSWTEYELSGLPWEVVDKMRKHSPLTYVNRVRTPTMILHSRDDRRCPLPMGQMFYQSLLDLRVPTQMVIYPDEGHGIRQPKHKVDVLQRTLDWFAKHDERTEERKSGP